MTSLVLLALTTTATAGALEFASDPEHDEPGHDEPGHDEPGHDEPGHDSAATESHDARGGHHYHVLVGAKATEMGTAAHGHSAAHTGGGIFAAWIADEKWLELELNVRGQTTEHGTAVPLSVLAKKPFHVSSAVHPYIGLGPAMELVPEADEESSETHAGEAQSTHMEAFFGAEAAAGSYFWLAHHIGLTAEVNYALINEHGALHEYGGGMGLVVGF